MMRVAAWNITELQIGGSSVISRKANECVLLLLPVQTAYSEVTRDGNFAGGGERGGALRERHVESRPSSCGSRLFLSPVSLSDSLLDSYTVLSVDMNGVLQLAS